MRLDKFLKVTRIIKRRTIANEACAQGKVKINGRVAKPANDVKPGDVIEIQFSDRVKRYQVIEIVESPSKEQSQNLYKEL